MRLLCFLLVLLARPALAQPEDLYIEAQTDGRTEPLEVRIAAEELNPSGPVWWRQQFNQLGTDYIRFHVRATGTSSGAVLEVKGPGGQVFSYDVAGIGEEGLWTGLVFGGRASVSLLADTRPDDLVIELDQISFEAETGAPYSVWGGKNENKHVNEDGVPEIVHALMSPIAKLVFQRGGLPRTCTGFLVGESTLLTNEHCINSDESCRSLAAVFGYEYGADNRLSFGEQFACTGFEPAWSSFELDATLVRLNGDPSARYGVIELGEATEIVGPLIVIQHPGGEPKQVSFIECSALADAVDGRGPQTDFTHTCDTAGGSSGSPVFDQHGRLVGLHHYGFAEGHIEDWTENRAVRILRIREWMQSENGSGAQPH